jgi:hypothetical protein|nr:MAG TPA: Structural protein [Caudoviricetes sp.]
MTDTNIQNLNQVVNGDRVVRLTNSEKISVNQNFLDMATLSSWYHRDPNKNHLGLINLYSGMAKQPIPSLKTAIETGAVLKVDGVGGRFSYDVPVVKPYSSRTNKDTSTMYDQPGFNGGIFYIGLDQKYNPGDVITYDSVYGEQAVVSEDEQIYIEGDVWMHPLKYVGGELGYFPPDKLVAGIEYFKIGHVLGEFSTQFSGIQTPGNVGTMTLEFELGNHRGVETAVTMYAGMKTLGDAKQRSIAWLEMLKEQYSTEDLNFKDNDMFVVYKKLPDGRATDAYLAETWEYLVGMELMKLEAYQNYFQKGALIKDINGTKRLNEGYVHQLRRGFRITYSKPGGITRSIFRQISSFLFRNSSIPIHERRIKLRVGYMAYLNVMQLFKDEALASIHGIQPLMNEVKGLPESPIKGKNLQNLTIEPVRFVSVPFDGIGIVEVEHDPTLDYQHLTDVKERGFFADGYPRTSFMMIIDDAQSPRFSNAENEIARGVKRVTTPDGKYNTNANVWRIEPKGASFWYGRREGRWSSRGGEILSSMNTMGEEFFAHSVSAVWLKDKSRTIIVELD